jgi:hypothetical protein
MTEAMLYASKISLTNAASVTQIFEFVNCSVIGSQELLVDDEGLRGQRSLQLERTTLGLVKVSGQIKLQPTPVELAYLLPLAMGTSNTSSSSSSSSTAYTDSLTDAMADVTLVMDLQTKANTFVGRFNKLTLGASPGKKLDVTVDFVGYGASYATMVGSGGTIAGVGDITNRPYMCSDSGSGLTIGGTTYSFDQFELEIDNKIDPTYMQGLYATDLAATGREVNLSARFKYTTTEQGLLGTAFGGPVIASPVAASIAFTNGSNSCTIALPAVIAEPKTVGATEKKIRLPLRYRCLKTGTTPELSVVTI